MLLRMWFGIKPALSNKTTSKEKTFEHIAEQAKDNFPYLTLLLEYAYGKPKESKAVNTIVEQPLFVEHKFPYHKLSDEALKEMEEILLLEEKENQSIKKVLMYSMRFLILCARKSVSFLISKGNTHPKIKEVRHMTMCFQTDSSAKVLGNPVY